MFLSVPAPAFPPIDPVAKVDSNVIEIPTIKTTGRVDGDRDTIGTKKRNYCRFTESGIISKELRNQVCVHFREFLLLIENPGNIRNARYLVGFLNVTGMYQT